MVKKNVIVPHGDNVNTRSNTSLDHSKYGEQEEEEEEQSLLLSSNDPSSRRISIKCSIILLMSLVVFASVIVLSAVWISSLLPSNIRWSNMERDNEFREIINSVSRTIVDLTHSHYVMRGQVLKLLDFSNASQIEQVTYQTYVTEDLQNNGLVQTVYIGDDQYNGLGIYHDPAEGPCLFNYTANDRQEFYYCDPDFELYDYCKRNNTPDLVLGPFDVSSLVDTCNDNPKKQIFAETYVDVTTPNYDTFITLLYCFSMNNKTRFNYYLAFDFTVASFSNFLVQATQKVHGSKSFIIETETNYVVAIDDPTIKVAIPLSDDTVERKTIKTLNEDRTREVVNFVFAHAQDNISNIECNQIQTFEDGFDYISLYRMCTETKIDWLFVMAIPKWNYLGTIVIGVVSSLCGAILIVLLSIFLSIAISMKIVKPFYNLIDQFTAISRMDLEGIEVKPSKFYEVRELQKQFLDMTHMIKLYRAFIPTHLLQQLDKKNAEEEPFTTSDHHHHQTENNKKQQQQQQQLSTHSSTKSSVSSVSLSSSRSTQNTSVQKQHHSRNPLNMFSLYLEKKKVTLLHMVFDGFSDVLSRMENPNDCIHMLSDVFDQVHTISKITGGLLGHFENDSFMMSFNSSIQHANHQEKGVLASKLLLERIESLKTKKWLSHMKNDELLTLIEALKIRIALTQQECLVGNVGTRDLKTFSIISSAKYNLEAMVKKAHQLDISIIVSEGIQHKTHCQYHSRYVGDIHLVSDHEYSSMHLGRSENIPQKLYEIGDSTNQEADEWMYELENQKKKQKWQKYNQACQLLFEKQYHSALNLFLEFSNENQGNDKPCLEMIELCQHHIHKAPFSTMR
ncbi:hypothetical protein FDP41_008693 [Naegleria fowleri]|uniref:Guanylate cyclase domain-containing protein n=1 Tax=Naegleria fowleri TaxID=5763 RepID=A0A6A5BJ05_NAEFO|nr:uncharacterized protein FDP41_008693 [Naegleria fowleri]KAF0973029.1 hypothetical protein FDP41_008693 [Naegleria fowleri]